MCRGMGQCRPMITKLVQLITLGLCLTGRSIQRAQEAADAKAKFVGMPEEQILACMGTPDNSAVAGGTEVWTYHSGNGHTDTFAAVDTWGRNGWASGFGSAISTSRYCRVDVVMTAGRVSRVNYSGPTGGLLTQGEQCAFAVDNCLH
jgi:hypothetical protein